MKKLIFLTSLFLFFGATSTVNAKEVCFTQYGGGETCVNVEESSEIDVDKKVSVDGEDFKNHLRSSEHTFDPNDSIFFKIKVKNTSKDSITINDVELKDILPSFVVYEETIRGPKPDDVNGKTISFDLGDIEKGGEETIVIRAKIVEDDKLPVDDKICVTNIAEVKGFVDDPVKRKDADYSNFCIDLPDILGEEAPTQLPKAGNEGVLAALGTMILGLGIIYNRRLTNSA